MNPTEQKKYSMDLETPQEEMVFIGYRRIPSREKVRYVLRHFNTIAGKYDFMNTLLSFGLHYLWKSWAVRILCLKRGVRVIDVCGGTAAPPILTGRAVVP